jgi:hypothetical protein
MRWVSPPIAVVHHARHSLETKTVHDDRHLLVGLPGYCQGGISSLAESTRTMEGLCASGRGANRGHCGGDLLDCCGDRARASDRQRACCGRVRANVSVLMLACGDRARASD